MQPINLLAPEVRANPYPVYAQMRRHQPVTQVEPGGMWAIARHHDVAFVLKNPQIFSSAGFQQAWQPAWYGDILNPLAKCLVAVDPPVHTKLRARVSGAFNSNVIQRIEPHTRRTIDALIDALIARGETDFMSDFASLLPSAVIGHLLGLEPSLHQHFRSWADAMVAIHPAPESPEHEARVHETLGHCVRSLSAAIAERRCAPGDDLLSQLVRVEVDGEHLTDKEVLELMGAVLAGGVDTTTGLLGSSMLFLSERPDVLEKLRADHGLIPDFIEEMMRYEPAVQALVRVTTAEVTLSGTTLPPGTLVLALIASANRDEEYYPNPDEFILQRTQPTLSFGHGIHGCIGAQLTRMEVRLALQALLTRVKRFSRLPGDAGWGPSTLIRGLEALPMRFEA